mgnify:CR=1 FL=1
MKNKKILTWALIVALTATGAAFASTNTSTWNTDNSSKVVKERPELTDEQKAENAKEIRTLMEKVKNWETLTDEEQTKVDNFKANMPERWEWRWHGWERWHWWPWMWGEWFWWEMNKLTDEEKTALESMTDEEKKAFFEEKRTEAETKRESRENVIDKLLAWETLTTDEETVRQEIITERAERKVKQEEMNEMRTLMEKVKNWETLTDEEQTKVDNFKANMPERWEWRWQEINSENSSTN